MTYFDTSYIAKCYLNEPRSERVRDLARANADLSCCELGRVEFASIVLRNRRERLLDRNAESGIWREFGQDEAAGVWHWLPMTSELIEEARQALATLPGGIFLRAADALHLACARMHGAGEIYSHDRHLLAAAGHFGLRAVDVISVK